MRCRCDLPVTVRPNSPPQITSVSVSKPLLLEILQQRRGRSIDFAAFACASRLRGASDGPTARHPICTNRTPRSTSRRATSSFAPTSVVVGARIPAAMPYVPPACGVIPDLDLLGFLGNIKRVRRFGLHLERHLEGLDPRFQLRVLLHVSRVLLVQVARPTPIPALALRRRELVLDVQDHFVQVHPLGVIHVEP